MATTKTLTVNGMNCGNCAASVKRALEKVPGVTSAEVSHERKLATVTCASGDVSEQALAKAVTDAGFEVG